MSLLVYKCTREFGLLSFQKKETKKKRKPHFVLEVALQHEPLSQPRYLLNTSPLCYSSLYFFLLSSIPNQAQLHTQVLAETRH